MKNVLYAALLSIFLISCGKLSSEAEKIVGTYYNPQISSDIPMFDLREDGTCFVRNIHPDVLMMEVKGTWNVEDDSLIVINDLSTVSVVGDTSIMGDVAPVLKRRVVSSDETTLILEDDGIEYLYTKHNKKK